MQFPLKQEVVCTIWKLEATNEAALATCMSRRKESKRKLSVVSRNRESLDGSGASVKNGGKPGERNASAVAALHCAPSVTVDVY